MFEKKINKWNDTYEEIQLFHIDKKLSISILPQLGGMLNTYALNGKNVIDGISLNKSGIKQYLAAYHSAFLCPFPNRIADGKFQFEGKLHQLKCNETANNSALHGFIADKIFSIKNIDTNEQEAIIVLLYIYKGDLAGFPYPFEVELEYKLELSGKLTCSSKISNTGKTSLPFGLGWHHYFTLGEPINTLHLSFATKHQIEFNERLLPTGQNVDCEQIKGLIQNKNYDDCFALNDSKISLESSSHLLEIEVEPSIFPYLQVYTPPHRKSIAIEPMTCIPDAFNNRIGLGVLEPNATSTQHFSLLLKGVSGSMQ